MTANKPSSNLSEDFLTPNQAQNWVRVERAADLGNSTVLPVETLRSRTRVALARGIELNGNNRNNVLRGTKRDDTLRGGGGNDQLYGKQGGDRLEGNAGRDRIFGRAGNDSLVGNTGNDDLQGEPGNDTIQGGNGDDRLIGADGRDLLQGGGGDDRLVGDSNVDRLEGGVGNDTLIGGIANDVLIGGEENDTLTGGPGRDRFTYEGLDDRRDEITDFDDDEDLLDLRKLFQGDAYSSSDRLDEYVVIVNEDDENTLIRVDPDGNNGDRPFITLVRIADVDFDDIGSRNFIV